MKSLLVICLFFLTYSVYSFGQVSNRISKIVETKYDGSTSEKSYEYDDNGNVSVELKEQHFSFDTSIHLHYGTFYEYNSSNQIQKKLYRRYNPDVDLFITIEWTDYTYNEDGCLIETVHTNNNPFVGILEKIEYERDKECRITKETVWGRAVSQFATDFKIQRVFERVFLADGISYTEKESYPVSNGLKKVSDRIYLFNEHGKIDTYYHTRFLSNLDTLYLEQKFYEYDFNQNLLYQKNQYYENGMIDWLTVIEHNYENHYDERGFLIKVKNEFSHYNGQPGNQIQHYDFTCDGLETSMVLIKNGSGINSKTETFYEGEDSCFEVKNADLKLSIFPNPTSGFLTIESPILQSGNTQISIFSTDGKVLLQKTEFKRSEQTSLDLGSDLPNGFYFVQLKNQDYQLIEKLILQR